MKRMFPLLLLVWSVAALPAQAGDWVHWRGPFQNGFAPDTDLPSKWSPATAGENNLLWKQPYGGRSTPLVMNGRVYIIDDAGEGLTEQERVACFDADTGKVLWEHRFNVFFTDIVSIRVGWASLAGDPETGNIYAHGVQGLFFCFDKDGKVLWSRSLTEEYGRISGYGGRVNSPIVDGDLVIMGMVNASWGDQARGANRFVAFDKRNGKVVWWSQPSELIRGTYSSIPVVTVINGQRLLISGTSGGEVVALKVGTGEPVWIYHVGAKSINISPVVDGTRVYIAHGEENLDTTEMGRVVCLDAAEIKDGKPKLVWKVDGITDKFVSPILHEGRLYVGDDSGRLFCLNADTGDLIWKYKFGKSSNGSPVLADGKIYVGEVNARFYILKPGPKNCQELSSVYLRSRDGTSAVEINGSPAVANGKIYFTSSEEFYCIGNKDRRPAPVAQQQATASDAPVNAKAAHLLVYPADVALLPGESAEFQLRAYDANGHFLREIKADEWSLPAPLAPAPAPGAKGPPAAPPALKGTITLDGKLTVDKMPPGQFGLVMAKASGLTARARIRVVPPMPIVQDFKNVPEGRTPGGWINTTGKFAVVATDAGKVLKKLANNANPLLARAHTYFSLPTLTDYTIQADLLGEQKNRDMPDMGVIANRYALFLDGNKQRLRLASWEALPRVDKSIDWAWKPGTWYRLKLTVDLRNGKGVVRGKAWPADGAEPAAWTIEFEDPIPNREGSPGLYGYATGILENEEGAAMYYANVQVTPNAK
jgi:outer membrane protein assembly factor BamB